MTRVLAAAVAIAATSVATSAVAADDGDSGVRGRVTAGPTCPVEPYPPDPACADRGFQTTIRIKALPERELVKTVRTGEKGRFRTRLEPGRYRLVPRSGKNGFPACERQDVVVKADQFTRVHLSCDTGIR
jgi:hypothetical protein